MIPLPLVIVAGGKSSRMGSDKALLPFDHSPTLTQFQLDRLQGYFSSIYISCKSKEKFDFHASFIEDDPHYAYSSPLVALSSILKCFQTPVCILSVDTPCVSPDIFTSLYSHMQTTDDAMVAKTPCKIHPLCAIYRPFIQEKITMMLQKEDHKMMHLLQNISTQYVNFENEEIFFNLNYRSDYDQAKEQFIKDKAHQ